jgi:verruculogen synthase
MTIPVLDAPVSIKTVDITTPPDEVVRLAKQDGVVMVKGFLDLELVRKLQEEVDPAVKEFPAGPNHESDIYKLTIGPGTKQMANLTMVSETFRHKILNHRWMHAVSECLFSPEFGDYWMNRGSILHIEPGEKAQGLHQDDGLYRVSGFRRPGDPELMINFLVALTEFREDNGATRVVPGSHRWDATHPRPSPEEAVSAFLQPGDAVIFFGSLFHAAGENQSPQHRRGMLISMHPCHFTPMESHLHVPREIIETMTPLAQKMVGWRSLDNQNHVPIWMAGDRRMEKVMGLKSKEI